MAPRLLEGARVTAFFWIIKALTTGMGESTSDFLVHHLVPEIAVVFGGIAFVIALFLQFSTDRYVPWRYWLAVAMVGVFGTMAADVLHVGLGVPYVVSTVFYAIVLAAVFRTWFRSEGTLSIHSITTERREIFYWAAVLATFALGTAAGDLTAVTFGLGYFGSGLLFAAVIAVPALGYYRFRHELDPGLLVRLRRHPPARCLLRRLARGLLRPGRAWDRDRAGELRPRGSDRRIRRLSDDVSRGHAGFRSSRIRTRRAVSQSWGSGPRIQRLAATHRALERSRRELEEPSSGDRAFLSGSGSSAPRQPANRRFDPEPEEEDQQRQDCEEADDSHSGRQLQSHQGDRQRDQEVGEQGSARGGAGSDVAGQAHHFSPERR